jgi:glutamyl-Q tRNA(Asp) synthetase
MSDLTHRLPPSAHAHGRQRCRGRFAPSPTGALHFGSLVAAVASYLAARQAGGEWLVRIEDVDRAREVPGSADSIIRTLAAFGFEWTGSIERQSTRTGAYEAALERLDRAGLVYPCSCSRKAIAAGNPPGTEDEPRYPGWCRNGPLDPLAPCAMRFKVGGETIHFVDEIQGELCADLERDCGDFVIKRRDGLFAYQLAVVVDDADQGITHVVRGADLLTSTPRQILLQRALGLAPLAYAHVPLATDDRGVKLSKSAGAGAVDATKPAEELWRALRFLRQSPPAQLRRAGLDALWSWAVEHWTTAPLRGLRQTAVVASSTVRSS